MGNVSRGRRLLVIVLGVYLAAMGWQWVCCPASDFGAKVIQVAIWGVLPVVLALLAGSGAAWARRALAVVWGLNGVLNFIPARAAADHIVQGGKEITLMDAITPAVVSLVCIAAALVVLVQRDVREMTRTR